jgi:hypothetical protein
MKTGMSDGARLASVSREGPGLDDVADGRPSLQVLA